MAIHIDLNVVIVLICPYDIAVEYDARTFKSVYCVEMTIVYKLFSVFSTLPTSNSPSYQVNDQDVMWSRLPTGVCLDYICTPKQKGFFIYILC